MYTTQGSYCFPREAHKWGKSIIPTRDETRQETQDKTRQEQVMYYISVRYYFYQGTINMPKDGPLKEEWNGPDKITFKSIEDAVEYLRSRYGAIVKLRGQRYTKLYHELSYGEYEAPEFLVRKTRQHTTRGKK